MALGEKRTSCFQGNLLQTYIWKPVGEIKALVHITHGMHEYMGRYKEIGRELMKNKIFVFGLDLVGHGRSEGDRGYILDIQSYATDAIAYIEDMKAKYPSVPMFLMGHSMGGLTAIMIAIQRPDLLTGLLLSAPAIYVNQMGPVVNVLVKMLAACCPQMGVLYIDPNLISTIPEEVERYINDPLIIHSLAKAALVAAMIDSIQQYQPRLNEISLPLFLMQGTADQIVPLYASELVDANVSSVDKTYELFTGSYHEVLHDKEQEKARDTITGWILARLT